MPTVRVPLNEHSGKRGYARVSIQDWPTVRDISWYRLKVGYAYNDPVGLMHRLILELPKGDSREGDHIDRDRLNNARSNLRITTHAQNHQNKSPVGGTSRYRGVHWDKRKQKWMARTKLNGKTIWLGYFTDEDAAGAAALEGRRKHLPFAID